MRHAIVREEDECTLGNVCSPAYRTQALLNADVSDEQSASIDVFIGAKTSLLVRAYPLPSRSSIMCTGPFTRSLTRM